VFLKDAAKQFGMRAAEVKLSSVESLSAMFASEPADWQQQQQQLLQQQQQLAACGGVFKCVEALAQNIPRLKAALTSNLESLGSSAASGGSVALALQSCEELVSLTRDYERLLRDAVQLVVAATRPRFSGAFDAMISAARAPSAASAGASGTECANGQSAACLQALTSVDAVYSLFKATLPEAVVEDAMMFILQVRSLQAPSSPSNSFLLALCFDYVAVFAERSCCTLGGGAVEFQKESRSGRLHAGNSAAAGLRRALCALIFHVEAKGQCQRVAAGVAPLAPPLVLCPLRSKHALWCCVTHAQRMQQLALLLSLERLADVQVPVHAADAATRDLRTDSNALQEYWGPLSGVAWKVSADEVCSLLPPCASPA
jgi:hypothetical protein